MPRRRGCPRGRGRSPPSRRTRPAPGSRSARRCRSPAASWSTPSGAIAAARSAGRRRPRRRPPRRRFSSRGRERRPRGRGSGRRRQRSGAGLLGGGSLGSGAARGGGGSGGIAGPPGARDYTLLLEHRAGECARARRSERRLVDAPDTGAIPAFDGSGTLGVAGASGTAGVGVRTAERSSLALGAPDAVRLVRRSLGSGRRRHRSNDELTPVAISSSYGTHRDGHGGRAGARALGRASAQQSAGGPTPEAALRTARPSSSPRSASW